MNHISESDAEVAETLLVDAAYEAWMSDENAEFRAKYAAVWRPTTLPYCSNSLWSWRTTEPDQVRRWRPRCNAGAGSQT